MSLNGASRDICDFELHQTGKDRLAVPTLAQSFHVHAQKKRGDFMSETTLLEMAEGAGFEPAVGFPTLDFESSALNRTQPPFLESSNQTPQPQSPQAQTTEFLAESTSKTLDWY